MSAKLLYLEKGSAFDRAPDSYRRRQLMSLLLDQILVKCHMLSKQRMVSAQTQMRVAVFEQISDRIFTAEEKNPQSDSNWARSIRVQNEIDKEI